MTTATELDAMADKLERDARQLRSIAAGLRRRPREATGGRITFCPAVDRSQRVLTSGVPEVLDPTYRETGPGGQQRAYVVLTATERAKGFVRPVREAYRHVGVRPAHPTRELTTAEHGRYDKFGYVAFEPYDRGRGGRFWTDEQLSSGCGKITTMSRSLAETYARDPAFYSDTFCTHCKAHFPVGANGEFTWYEMDGTEGPRVGT
jgi:hypothetical protein